MTRAPAALVAIACVPLAAASLVLPFGRDQGIYAWSAARWLDGAVLYRDIYVFKAPLTVWIHALAEALFGRTMTAIRLLDVGWSAVTAVALFTAVRGLYAGQGRAIGTNGGAALAALGWAFAYHHYDYWNTAQTDGWAALPMALALALATRPGLRLGAAAGFALGLVVALKVSLLALAPAVCLAGLAAPDVDDVGAAARRTVVLLAGAFLAVAAMTAAIALSGGGAAFLEAQRDVLLPYAGAPSTGRDWKLFDRFLWLLPDPVVYLAPVGAVLAVLRAGRAWIALERPVAAAWLVAPAWLLGAATSLVAQGKFFPYHYLPLLAPAALCATIALVLPLDVVVPERLRARAAAVVCAAAFAGACTDDPYPARWRLLRDVVTGDKTIEAYWRSGKFKNKDMSLVDNLDMAAWLRANTDAGATTFLWTYDPMIYFLADRPMVSRFPYTYPLVVAWGPDALDAELLAALRANPPEVFVVGSKDATPKVMGHSRDSLATFRASGPIHRFIDRAYVLTTKVGRFAVYRRVPSESP